MKILSGITALAVTLLLSTLPFSLQGSVHSQTRPAAPVVPTADRHKKAKQEARKMVAELVAQQNIPGLSVSVAVDGEIVWSEGFGFPDLENRAEVRPPTRFRHTCVP